MLEAVLDKVSDNDSFKRINSTHPLDIYIGKDIKGYITVLLSTEHDMKHIPKSTEYINVSKHSQDNKTLYAFCLENKEFRSVFFNMFNDIAEFSSKSNSEDKAFLLFWRRYYMWSKLFKKKRNSFLSKSEILGLIGEIYFLKKTLTNEYSIDDSVKSWFGPLYDKKDFEINNKWFEIKMTKLGSQIVTINDVNQLDDARTGELIVFEYSNAQSSNGISLFKLVEEVLEKIADINIIDIFLAKLSSKGYEHDEYYKEDIVIINRTNRIVIDQNSDILRLKKLPTTIHKLKYDLYYNLIKGDEDNGE